VRIVQQLDEHLWREFVDNHPQGNVFHTPEMFEVFDKAEGHRPMMWAAVDGDGRPLALLPAVQITLMGGLLHRLTTRAVAYGGILCAPGPEGTDALSALLEVYRREGTDGALFTELRNLSDVSGLQPALKESNFVYEDHLDYLIDLDRSPDDLLSSIGRRTRKNIRRGLRRGDVIMEEVKGQEGVDTCYDMLRRTYSSADVPLADKSLFEATFDVLYPKNMVRFTVARVDQAIVAISVELLYRDVVYGWYGGLDREYGAYVPNELLMWHILEWSIENDYKVYDFGGAGKPDEEYGPRKFKAKFRGDLVCYGRNTCIHAPALLQLSQWGYAAYRRFL